MGKRQLKRAMPKAKAGASLSNNTEIRALIAKFYKKIPDAELAAAVTRLTGEICEPRYLRYLARPAQMPTTVEKVKGVPRGRPITSEADNAVGREAGKAALNLAQEETGVALP